MNVKKELEAIKDRIFTEELLETVLAAYRQEMEEIGYGVSEKEYAQGKGALASVLDQEQKALLAKAERACWEDLAWGLRLAFDRGVFAGFQQYFVPDAPANPFQKLIMDGTKPYKPRCTEGPAGEEEADSLFPRLHGQLDEGAQEHLVSIEAAWEDRLYGVLRYGFYMGYRASLSVIQELFPAEGFLNMVGKVFLTEHELGLTETREERERFGRRTR